VRVIVVSWSWYCALNFLSKEQGPFSSSTTTSNKHHERKPWEFLFIASVLFLVFEAISLLIFLGVIQQSFVDMGFWSKVFEFLYSGFVLLAFISQHDLIINNHLILISKKDHHPSEKNK